MTSTEYIIKKIDELQNIGINACVNYAYDQITNFHVVEVAPESIRRGDETYMEWEYSTWKEFADLFPDEDLLISEEDEMNDMSNAIYSYKGFGFLWNYPITNQSFDINLELSCAGEINYSFAA